MGITFDNKSLSELQNVLTSIYSKTTEQNQSVVSKPVLALSGILAGDIKLYNTAVNSGGEQTVCKALEERDKILLAEKDAEIAEKDAEIAEKDAEIAELKRRLAGSAK